MKKSSISVLAVMLIVCIVSVVFLIPTVSAENFTATYAVGIAKDDAECPEGAIAVSSIQEAFAEIEKVTWDSSAKVQVLLKADPTVTLSGGGQNGVLFGQSTIFRSDDSKLPITMRGLSENAATFIYLDAVGGWYACANDYHFENLTLSVGDCRESNPIKFFAGSGNVTFDNCLFKSVDENAITTVYSRTKMYEYSKAAALAVAQSCAGLNPEIDLNIIPCGTARQNVRHDPDYTAYGESIGVEIKTDAKGVTYIDMDLTGANGDRYGDFSHAGNTGGGQYLNACVYYEVILGLPCKENPWRPDYNLPEELVVILQDAAHDAVLELYGKEHFQNKTITSADIVDKNGDVGSDGIVNVLMMGSSSSYYMREELHEMANEIGITLNIYHAYSSGIAIKTQWDWCETGTGEWKFYENANGKEIEIKSTKYWKFSEVINYKPYDAVVTYQTGGAFSKYGFDESRDTVDKCIASCEMADEFIQAMYNANNQNARYFWFMACSAPISLSNTSDSYGFLYGDNCTLAVYDGWTDAQIAKAKAEGNGKIVSSITLGDNCVYNKIQAIGYLAQPETPFTDETAKEVRFMDATSNFDGYTMPDIRPWETHGQMIVDGKFASSNFPLVRGTAYSPATATLWLKNGSMKQPKIDTGSGATETYWGDTHLKFTGGEVDKVDALNYGHIVGNYTFEIGGDAVINGMVRTAFNSNTVSGTFTLNMTGGTVLDAVYSGAGAAGGVYNNISGGTLKSEFWGTRAGAAASITNHIGAATFEGQYCGGHWANTALGPIQNIIDGATFKGMFIGGQKTTGAVNPGTVVIDGKNVELDIYNSIKNTTFEGNFVAGNNGTATHDKIRNDLFAVRIDGSYNLGNKGGGCGIIENNISNMTFATYYGGMPTGTVTNIINNIENVTAGTYYGGMATGTVGTITNNITSLTVNGSYYGGSEAGTVTSVLNKVDAANITANYYGGCRAEKAVLGSKENEYAIKNVINGITMTGDWGGASYQGKVTGNIINEINGGDFVKFNGGFIHEIDGAVMTVDGDIKNTVKGNVNINKTFAGATLVSSSGYVTSVTGTIYNTFDKDSQGNYPKLLSTAASYSYYGAGHFTEAQGGVVNEIKAGQFDGLFLAGNFKTLAKKTFGLVPESEAVDGVRYSVVNKISGGTFCTKGASSVSTCYFWGGIATKDSGAIVSGGFYTEVENATFNSGYFSGSGRQLSTELSNPVVINIKSGTFKGTVCLSGCGYTATQNDAYTIASCVATISGGTFSKAVYAGGRGSQPILSSTLTIQGGTFKDAVVAGSMNVVEDNNCTVILQPTVANITLEKATAPRSAKESIQLKGGSRKILIDADAAILADAYDGEPLTIEQTAGWVADTVYLTVNNPQVENINLTKSQSATGYVKKVVGENETQWIGISGAELTAASLILNESINVRLWFDKALVDAVGSDLTFDIKRADLDTSLLTGTYADLIAGEIKTIGGIECYTIVLPATAPSAFHVDIAISGNGLTSFNASINEVLSLVIANENSEYTDGFVQLAKTLWNYGIEAYERFAGEESLLIPETVGEPESATVLGQVNNSGDGSVIFAGKSLVLREAVGIKLYGLANVSSSNLRVVANGKELSEDQFEFKAETGSSNYNMSITLFIKAKNMADEFTIEIYNGDAFVLSLTESVASCCQQYIDAAGRDAELCKAILAYIQAVPGMNA